MAARYPRRRGSGSRLSVELAALDPRHKFGEPSAPELQPTTVRVLGVPHPDPSGQQSHFNTGVVAAAAAVGTLAPMSHSYDLIAFSTNSSEASPCRAIAPISSNRIARIVASSPASINRPPI